MSELIGPEAVAAYLAVDMLRRILGPSADRFGEYLEGVVEHRKNTIAKILSNAEKKAGPRLDSPGQVPLKVLKEVLNEGSYAEGDLAVEYIGGVLASSRTEMGRDDRGARLLKIVDSLSSYQLRTHYLVYSTIAHKLSNSEHTFSLPENRRKMRMFIPYEEYCAHMAFEEDEWGKIGVLLSHIWHGLSADELIANNALWGQKEYLCNKTKKSIPSDGIVCQPSVSGAELFLWAFGHGDKPLNYVFSGEIKTQIPNTSKMISGAVVIG